MDYLDIIGIYLEIRLGFQRVKGGLFRDYDWIT